MYAEPSSKAPIRVLVAENSEDTAAQIDSVLRDAGYATRLQFTDNFDEVRQLVIDNDTDLIYMGSDLDQIDSQLPAVRAEARHIPIIVVSTEHPVWTSAEAMALGASDLVCLRDVEHLSLVSMREIEHVSQRVRNLQLDRALSEVEQRCKLLLQGSKAPIAYIHEGMHIYANQAYRELFGCEDEDDVLGVSIMDFLDGECAQEFKAQLKHLRDNDEEVRFPFSGHTLEEEPLAGTMVLAHASYEGEACLQASILLQDNVTPATVVATEDDGNLDLGSFLQLCEANIEQDNESFVVLFSVDGLEEVRNHHGLAGIERATEAVFEVVETAFPKSPVLRMSAGEYAVGLFNSDERATAAIANEVRQHVASMELEIEERSVHLSMLAAAVVINADTEHALDAAYQLLQEARSDGEKNSVVLVPQAAEDEPELDEAGKTLARINAAIEAQSFRLLYQPIISLRGDADEHYEVFLRMLDAEGNEYVPNDFLQTAIEHNVAAKIDRWVILQAIKALCVHRSKGHNTRLTINVTSNSVADPEFIKWLTVAIKAARLPSDAVIFQITESDANTYVRQTREFVEGLQEMHCQVGIGRFGLLDEPFELLRHIPVDMVKLDGTHVQTLEDEESKIKKLLKELQEQGKFTIVPMVESAGQLSSLWQAGANYVQGHYLQEPTPEMDYDFSLEDD